MMVACRFHLLDSHTTAPAISVRGLTKRYGERAAVDRFDLEVPRGVVAGFVGPNGAGKTTTMAMLLGLVRPSAGEGKVLGSPIRRPASLRPPHRRADRDAGLLPAPDRPENLRLLAIVGRHDPSSIPALLELAGLARTRPGSRSAATRSA